MSESSTTCPRCKRLPGQIHPDDCPRSRESLKRLALRCALKMDPRMLWVSASLSPGPGGRLIMGTYHKGYGPLTAESDHAGRFLRAVRKTMRQKK